LAIPAPKLGATVVKVGASEEPVRNITLRLTQLFNLSGHPAITAPCGRTVEGLPIAAQLVAHRGRTRELLQLTRALESYLTPGMSR
jgi:aspartyl-tRNA(Asn)/glutamyl-tRNA(Gln) amidotransferase subunit A